MIRLVRMIPPRPRDYREYLRSPEWKQKADLVRWRDHGLCRGCLSAPATETHHLTYDRLGHELLCDLVSLCRACHARIHGREE